MERPREEWGGLTPKTKRPNGIVFVENNEWVRPRQQVCRAGGVTSPPSRGGVLICCSGPDRGTCLAGKQFDGTSPRFGRRRSGSRRWPKRGEAHGYALAGPARITVDQQGDSGSERKARFGSFAAARKNGRSVRPIELSAGIVLFATTQWLTGQQDYVPARRASNSVESRCSAGLRTRPPTLEHRHIKKVKIASASRTADETPTSGWRRQMPGIQNKRRALLSSSKSGMINADGCRWHGHGPQYRKPAGSLFTSTPFTVKDLNFRDVRCRWRRARHQFAPIHVAILALQCRHRFTACGFACDRCRKKTATPGQTIGKLKRATAHQNCASARTHQLVVHPVITRYLPSSR